MRCSKRTATRSQAAREYDIFSHAEAQRRGEFEGISQQIIYARECTQVHFL
ncbi:hypothetical protein [Brunnivagina elsteri]|uniref:hypothetical protein n=1 Tax=Brunnivagina elsteri TaxID=1247191 RepID=UPI001B80DFFC|nr:hypothetical protein [Calothrix elsteri]